MSKILNKLLPLISICRCSSSKVQVTLGWEVPFVNLTLKEPYASIKPDNQALV